MLQAHEALSAQGVRVRSLSIPCFGLLKTQPEEYIEGLLPLACRARISIEAGRRDQWAALVGLDGEHVGLSTFGASGPEKLVRETKGFTVGNILEAARRVLQGKARRMPSSEVTNGQKRRKVIA